MKWISLEIENELNTLIQIATTLKHKKKTNSLYVSTLITASVRRTCIKNSMLNSHYCYFSPFELKYRRRTHHSYGLRFTLAIFLSLSLTHIHTIQTQQMKRLNAGNFVRDENLQPPRVTIRPNLKRVSLTNNTYSSIFALTP